MKNFSPHGELVMVIDFHVFTRIISFFYSNLFLFTGLMYY